ncbi:nucleosome assembly protein 1;2-like isoform X2 [Ziziphus jujuba]|uniref:Nucleosome assembly protein 12-like isoform X2 n=1 Tax=Ziziphus jujuba TaxID=326968 RepID=A0ABM3IU26_ZIZJJ|nr:nucleosome assembly protein 1;2-like isoform X2 [Ziziphus jujuba]
MSNKGNLNMSRLIFVLNEEEGEGLVNPLKDRIQSLAGQHSDMLENLSPEVRESWKFLQKFRHGLSPCSYIGLFLGCIIFALKSLFHLHLQSQHDELEVNFFEERAAIEAKYRKLYRPPPTNDGH